MNKKQKGILAILVLMTSTLVVVIVSVVPWQLLESINGGGGGEPTVYYDNLPSAPILNDIQPDPDPDGIIVLTWSASVDVWYYNIYRSDSSGVEIKIAIGRTDNSFIDGVSKEEGMYYYRIEAVNNIGKVQSNTETVSIAVPDEAPDAPVLKTIIPSHSTDGEIKLEWDSVSGATMYTIFRWEDGINLEILDQDFSENYYDDSVSSSGVYLYKVKAGNDEKKYSDYSNEVSVTVQIPGVPDVPYMNQLEYEIINYTIKIYIDWDSVDCDSYVLYRSFSDEVYKPVEGGVYSATGYTESLTEVGTYVYKVSAINLHGESERSNTVTIEITEDGVAPLPPPSADNTMLYILFGVLAVLIVPVVILVKKKKRRS